MFTFFVLLAIAPKGAFCFAIDFCFYFRKRKIRQEKIAYETRRYNRATRENRNNITKI